MPAKTQATDDTLSRLARQLAFVDSVTMGERGQVAIPAEVRRELELAGGSKLFVLRVEGQKGFLVLTAEGLAELARSAPPDVIARVFRAGAGAHNGGGGDE